MYLIYKCFSSDGVLLYVGCTRSLDQRIIQHRQESSWFQLLESISISKPIADKRVALALERKEIMLCSPIHNRYKKTAHKSELCARIMEKTGAYKRELRSFVRRKKTMHKMRAAGKTLQQIGDHFGISRQRVAQILTSLVSEKYIRATP